IEVGRLLSSIATVDASSLADRTSEDWVRGALKRDSSRELVRGLMRVATYVADLDELSADVGVRQLQMVFGGVLYVDGGWLSVARALQARAEERGAVMVADAKVGPIQPDGERWIVPTPERSFSARRVVIAGLSPDAAARVAGSADLAGWAATATPALAAVFDVGLSALPVPDRRFAYGMGSPFYFSVPDREGVFVAGDWVGPVGHLSDASIASAAAVARQVVADITGA
ncbi:MAG: hypothetical protein OEV40_30335, partial [Acidimicrobiia bacterium]|nr:hypothetical protein [Acidimicrobiia bacterium]